MPEMSGSWMSSRTRSISSSETTRRSAVAPLQVWPATTKPAAAPTSSMRTRAAAASSSTTRTLVGALVISSAGYVEQQGFALAAAAAQAGRAEPAPAAGEFEGQVQRDPGTRRTDRMPHRDRATVDVHVLIGDVQITHRLQRHRRERLVDLEQIHIVRSLALPAQGLEDRIGGLG